MFHGFRRIRCLIGVLLLEMKTSIDKATQGSTVDICCEVSVFIHAAHTLVEVGTKSPADQSRHKLSRSPRPLRWRRKRDVRFQRLFYRRQRYSKGMAELEETDWTTASHHTRDVVWKVRQSAAGS